MSPLQPPQAPLASGRDATAVLERTGRAIVAGTWACAVIVMVASTGNAVLTFGALGGNRTVGLGIGVAVDVALCVALIGDRRLYAHGLSSSWVGRCASPRRPRPLSRQFAAPVIVAAPAAGPIDVGRLTPGHASVQWSSCRRVADTGVTGVLARQPAPACLSNCDSVRRLPASRW